MTTVVWRGLDEPRMELARVQRDGTVLRASGTQIGVTYELRHELAPELLRLESGLLDGGAARDYVMRWISVPELEVSEQQQRYAPLPDRVVRFRSGDFVAEIRFGDDGLVHHYPGLAERVA